MATTAAPTTAGVVADLLARSRYEVIPLAGVEEKVLEHVPRDVTITVTASPLKGLEPTFELASSLAAHGYPVVPHLSARLIVDRAHLAEIVAQVKEMGVDDVFVVAGDADTPAGEYEGAGALLDALDELGRPFSRVGITGYPESHPLIDDWTTIASMFDKAEHASYIASQICFDSRVTVEWVNNVWARGTQLPILVGIPGIVPRAKLMRVSTKIGIGESLRYLRKHNDFVMRFLRPGGFSPDRLIKGLAPVLGDPEGKVGGFHIFTFNELADTEAWRQRMLARGR
jgi:methylenetetrahydrofolate reductase (NADPH)